MFYQTDNENGHIATQNENAENNMNHLTKSPQDPNTSLIECIIDSSCGKYSFIDIDVKSDKFFKYLQDCGADIDEIVQGLSKKNILFGTPAKTPHECPQHLRLQMDELKPPIWLQKIIEAAITLNKLDNAVMCLQEYKNGTK